MGEATGILISLIIVSGVIIGITAFTGDVLDNYGIASDDLTYLNKTSEINTKVTEIKDTIEDTQITGVEVIDLPLTFIAGAYSALKLLLNIPDIMMTLLMEAGEVIGIPAWAIAMGTAIVVIIIVFVVLRAILKWDV